jgi:hypothetical protein
MASRKTLLIYPEERAKLDPKPCRALEFSWHVSLRVDWMRMLLLKQTKQIPIEWKINEGVSSFSLVSQN